MRDPNPAHNGSNAHGTIGVEQSIESLLKALLICSAVAESTNGTQNQTTPSLQKCNLASGSLDINSIFSVDPDISGIGVSISFMIQGAFFAVFGPLLGIAFILLPKRQNTSVKRHLKRLKDLSTMVRSTSAFLSFSTLLASCVCLRQAPMPLETLYLIHLADYLSQMASGGLWISWSLTMGPLTKVSFEVIYVLCETINKMLADNLNGAARRELVPSLVRAQVQIQSLLGSQPQPLTQGSSGTSDYGQIEKAWTANGPISWTMWPITFAASLLLGIAMIFVATSDRPIFRMRRISDVNLISLGQRFFFNRAAASMLLVMMNLLVLTLTIHSGWVLWDSRTNLMPLNGTADPNNQWRFGQVTAVLLWVPSIFWIIRNLLRLVPWQDMLISIVMKLMPGSFREVNTALTVFAVIYLCIGITSELDKVDPLMKEPQQDLQGKRKQSGDDQDQSELRPPINPDDIEMSGALPIPTATTEETGDGPSASHVGSANTGREAQSSDKPFQSLQSSREDISNSRRLNGFGIIKADDEPTQSMLRMKSRPSITRRHSG